MSSVTLSSVGLVYPDGTVGLDDVHLSVGDGEFVALVGPSGSGKTTLLRTVAGFLAPTTGTLRIGDQLVAGGSVTVPPERRGLGMAFQQQAIWPHWDVARNISYPLERARIGKRERGARVDDALKLVGLAGMGARDPATLSGGQRQRVALARALVARPRVLLLDEALSALDEPLRDTLRLELQTLTRSIGLTVVHVTHDREEALALADRVVVLDRGRIAQVGTPPDLVDRPATAEVARFLSDATILAGGVDASGFSATGHPCRVDRALLDAVGRPAGTGVLAVLPDDVELVPSEAGVATVMSSLFGRDGNDVVVDWAGTRVRCRLRGMRPLVGGRVDVVVRRALFYPSEREPADPASFGVTEQGGIREGRDF